MSESMQYAVLGMTCGHCVNSVIEEISKIENVTSVSVELNAGAASLVTVESKSAVLPDSVNEAVHEAGYELSSS